MFETGLIKFFFKKKVGQVIVKEPCFTDQRLILFKKIGGNNEMKDSKSKYLVGPQELLHYPCLVYKS